jgi:regulator of protease activity HflC (stomatin/prohibitin superfamily)
MSAQEEAEEEAEGDIESEEENPPQGRYEVARLASSAQRKSQYSEIRETH